MGGPGSTGKTRKRGGGDERLRRAPEAAPYAPSALAAGHPEPELLEAVLRLTSARIAYIDRNGRFLYSTPGVEHAAGVPVERLIGHTLADLDALAAHQERLETLRIEMIETGKAVRHVVTFGNDTDGLASELALEPVHAADGTVEGAVVTAWDVTELTRASRRVARLDRTYAILSEINQAIVRVRDRDRLLQEACRIAAELGGFEAAWVGLVEPNGDVRIAFSAGPKQSSLEGVAVSIRDEPTGRGAVGTAIRENRPVFISDAQGDERMAAWRMLLAGAGCRSAAAFPIHVASEPIGAFVMYSSQFGHFDTEEMRLFEVLAGDISFALDSLDAERGRAEAEAALRESEGRYRDLFEMNPLSMWVFDVETLRFLAVNDAAVHNYGYSREEFLEMTLADIRPPEDVPALIEDVAKPLGSYRPRGSWRHTRKDGTPMDVEVSGHELEFDGRRARLISAIDVTERRRLEGQLAEATRMEAMGHLAGGIAHDFNNLLTAVIGYADLLVAELGDSPLADEAREIRHAGTRAAELTHQVLAFARRQVLETRPVDLNAVVESVSQMMRRLIGEQIRLVTNLAPQPAVVMADPGQLEQVLVNLAINARDAMPEGGLLEISLARVEDAASLDRGIDGPAVLLAVRDTGTGMDAETLAHAFEPFFTTKQAGAGTGLGLATVYGIVHQSNGRIWADSDVDRGTTISVLLRQVDADPEPLAAPPPATAAETACSATILVVEDAPTVRTFVVSTLQRAGYRVLVAGSPAEAVALTDGLDEPIELLLTDLIMPDTNGRVLAQRLVAARPSMRVVVMSGYGASPESVPPRGTAGFLAKPFSRDELMTTVAQALAGPSRPSRMARHRPNPDRGRPDS
jgi:two-component system cell cycle sensor histidine kinase/response regulator CckA